MSTCSRTWEKRATGTEVGIGIEMKTGSVAPRIPSPRLLLVGVFILIGSLAAMPQDQPATQPPVAQTPEQGQAAGPGASSQAPQAEPQGAAPLRVLVGKSL